MEIPMEFTTESEAEFEKLKSKTTRYCIFKANEEKNKVLVESIGERDATFNDFKEAMPKDQPRWAVYDLHVEREDGSTTNKLVLFLYSPDAYTGSDKFFYATAKSAVENHFIGTNKT